MEVRDVEFDFVGYMSARFNHPPRTDGLHVSQIYGDLDKLINKQRYASGMAEDDLSMFGQIGFLWERVLEVALADVTIGGDPARYFRPGELLHEGLLLTPDYADLDFFGNGSLVMGLEEWKVCWKSVNAWADFEKNFWRWKVQMMAYCYALGILHARMRVLFIAGDWKGNIVPQVKMREFTFTERELTDNWQMLVRHAERKGWTK